MSTELYFQIEARTLESHRWYHVARIRLSTDYRLFTLLAGVRADVTARVQMECLTPKGLPDDVTEFSLSEDLLTVDDEAAKLEIPDTCSRAKADAWVNEGVSRYIHDGSGVTHPDFYAHSWATLDELQVVRDRYRSVEANRDMPELNAVIALMASLVNDKLTSRAVFWFGD